MRILAIFFLWLFLGFLQAQENARVRLRILSGNLTSGRLQSYDPGHGARILQGLHPDIVLLQEFRAGSNQPEDIASWVRSVFGTKAVFYREEGELPNGIISRFPILQSGEWDDPTQTNRDFAWARIDIPGSVDLWAVSVHLSASNEKKRIEAADTLIENIKRLVPEGSFLVIGGDFNAQNRNETIIRKFSTIVETDGPAPTDQAGNENTNHNRNKPYDWLLANEPLQNLLAPVPLGGSLGGLVFDSRTYEDLNWVSPVLREDSDAENMQHMAVIRDFLIPVASATPAPEPNNHQGTKAEEAGDK